MLDDPLWEPKRPRTKFEAWIDLCARAKGSPGRELVGHSMIPLERGQLIFTYLGLSKDWKWSRNKVRAFIASLEDEGRARIEPKEKDTPVFTLTICDYDKWNPLKLEKGHPRDTPKDEEKDTSHRIQSPLNINGCEDNDLKKDTPQSGKKDTSNNKDLKDIYSVEVEKVFDAYNTIIQIRSRSDTRKSKIRARLKEYGKEKVLKAIENYHRALNDPDHYFTHRFPIEKFMTPENIDRFLHMYEKEDQAQPYDVMTAGRIMEDATSYCIRAAEGKMNFEQFGSAITERYKGQTVSPEAILEAWKLAHREFGENDGR